MWQKRKILTRFSAASHEEEYLIRLSAQAVPGCRKGFLRQAVGMQYEGSDKALHDCQKVFESSFPGVKKINA
jgi:hypothetical protein